MQSFFHAFISLFLINTIQLAVIKQDPFNAPHLKKPANRNTAEWTFPSNPYLADLREHAPAARNVESEPKVTA